MKLSKSKIKQIIREEIQKIMTEEFYDDNVNEQSGGQEQVLITIKSPEAKIKLQQFLRGIDPGGDFFDVGHPAIDHAAARRGAIRDLSKTSADVGKIFSKDDGDIAAKMKRAMSATGEEDRMMAPVQPSRMSPPKR